VASPISDPIMKVTVDVKNVQATEDARGSDLVVEGMMNAYTAHAGSMLTIKTLKTLESIFMQGPSFAAVKRSRQNKSCSTADVSIAWL